MLTDNESTLKRYACKTKEKHNQAIQNELKEIKKVKVQHKSEFKGFVNGMVKLRKEADVFKKTIISKMKPKPKRTQEQTKQTMA